MYGVDRQPLSPGAAATGVSIHIPQARPHEFDLDWPATQPLHAPGDSDMLGRSWWLHAPDICFQAPPDESGVIK